MSSRCLGLHCCCFSCRLLHGHRIYRNSRYFDGTVALIYSELWVPFQARINRKHSTLELDSSSFVVCITYQLCWLKDTLENSDLFEFQFATLKTWLIKPYLIEWLIHSLEKHLLTPFHVMGTAARLGGQHWTSMFITVMEPSSSHRGQQRPPTHGQGNIWGLWALWKKKKSG